MSGEAGVLSNRQAHRERLTATAPERQKWFALRAAPQKEESAVRILGMRSFNAFIPTMPREHRARGKVRKWRVPVMPGYVLIGFPEALSLYEMPWWPVLKLDIIKKVVGLNGLPFQIPWDTSVSKMTKRGRIIRYGISEMLDDEDSVRIGASKFMRVWGQYVVGDPVRIEHGPFFGFQGKVENISETESTVLLDIFGALTPVTIPVEHATKAA